MSSHFAQVYSARFQNMQILIKFRLYLFDFIILRIEILANVLGGGGVKIHNLTNYLVLASQWLKVGFSFKSEINIVLFHVCIY